MKKILGLDLGVSSIGWAVIQEDENKSEILGMGSRIIPLSTDDADEFTKGNAISKNQKRTTQRTQRKGLDRYQLRRNELLKFLSDNKMMPNQSLFNLNAFELYGLRGKSVKERITLEETGRILLHLNQKRGYKSSRSEANADKKDTDYVAEVKNRHQHIKDEGITIGQYFFNGLTLDKNSNDWKEFAKKYNLPEKLPFRTKQQVFPREAYIEEFEKIWNFQSKYYPNELTNDKREIVKNEIIYYQRKLKSQKGLVSICEFEGFWVKDKKSDKKIFAGPKVAPKSSPLFQISKIWETINTLSIKNKSNDSLEISLEQKQAIFDYLDKNEKLTETKLFEILDIKKNSEWIGNKQTSRGIQGNITKVAIIKNIHGVKNIEDLIRFELKLKDITEYSKETGEIFNRKIIDGEYEKEPLYRLWHTIYSISDMDECSNAIQKNFGLNKETADKLAKIDFTKYSFGNKSTKVIRKTMPYLMQGLVYSDAMSLAGYNHSNSETKDEITNRKLVDKLKLINKNELRQPIVEKILNQMIHQVNAIIEHYGKPDEIRVELARELKQSKEERNDTFSNLNKRERENEGIRKRLEEYNLRATRNNVIKWRLFQEISNEESKVNATCIYCGKSFGVTDALNGSTVDVEHIIPKDLIFDDSQSNKTLAHRKCNQDKGNRTAYDFMKQTKSEAEFVEYLDRVDSLYKARLIGKGKRDKLLLPLEKMKGDFIARQLRETQYIAKKSIEILKAICHHVHSTNGSVTEHLRRIWGWDDVLMNLQFEKHKAIGQTEWVEWETNGQVHKKEVIKDWSKRNDHRHHAIDALAVSCTKQGFIQRISTLHTQKTKDELFKIVETQGKELKQKLNLLDKYLVTQKPFHTAEIEEKAAEILISYKAGKKVATKGVRKVKGKVVQDNIIVPRGALSEESVYGKIKAIEKYPVKYLFENPHLIFKPKIKKLVKERLAFFENDTKKAIASLKKEPIYLDEDKAISLEFGSCYKNEYVLKYPIGSIKEKDVPFIIDTKVREIVKNRLAQYGNKEKEAFKDLENNPVWFNEEKRIPIKTIRMFTGLSLVEPVKKDGNGKNIGFVKPGNNHHIAIYKDLNGSYQQHIATFWHAVERKKYSFSPIIENPKAIWDKILENKQSYPEEFLEKLPNENWKLELSLQQNEMFILGMKKDEFEKAVKEKNWKQLSNYLYRTQKMSIKGSGSIDLTFRYHLETKIEDSSISKEIRKFYNIQSVNSFFSLNPIKVYINRLGNIKPI
jgi:CRISPR-associated endonuclease Csn1